MARLASGHQVDPTVKILIRQTRLLTEPKIFCYGHQCAPIVFREKFVQCSLRFIPSSWPACQILLHRFKLTLIASVCQGSNGKGSPSLEGARAAREVLQDYAQH